MGAVQYHHPPGAHRIHRVAQGTVDDGLPGLENLPLQELNNDEPRDGEKRMSSSISEIRKKLSVIFYRSLFFIFNSDICRSIHAMQVKDIFTYFMKCIIYNRKVKK